MNTRFLGLAGSFAHIRSFPSNEAEKVVIKRILQDLVQLDYRYPVITNNSRAVLLINQICTIIPTEEEHFVSLSCALIEKLLNVQKVTVEGRTLEMAVSWIISTLKLACNKDLEEESILHLRNLFLGLESLLRSQDAILLDIINLKVLLAYIKFEKLKEYVIKCLEALLVEDIKTCEPRHDQYTLIGKILINELQNASADLEINVKYYALKGLKHLVIICPHFLSQELAMLMGICKGYMVYKLPNIESIKIDKLLASVMTIEIPSSAIVQSPCNKNHNKRKQRPIHSKTTKETDETPPPVDMSDTSDFASSDENDRAKLYKYESKIRQESLLLLLTISKRIEKSMLFSYFSQFIPDTFITNGHFITVAILKDPSTKGRMAALICLQNMLVTSKEYLLHAEGKSEVLSFTPMSMTIAVIIKELHHCLCLASNETSYPVLTQVLKCITALVQATPYHKVHSGLSTKLIRNVRQLIDHKDSTVQVAALIVLTTLLTVQPPIKEINDDIKMHEEAWLLKQCVYNLANPVPAPIKIESLQLLAAMINFYTTMLQPHLREVTDVIDISLADKYFDVRFHAGKAVEQIGEVIDQGSLEGVTFWQTIFESLLGLVQCEQPTLRSMFCNSMGMIGPKTFELLPKEKQLTCITTLLSLAQDEDHTVKGNAIRSVAIILLYPTVRNDIGYVMDSAEIIKQGMLNSNIVVRSKASWSLGNLSDALVQNLNDGEEEIPKEYLNELIRVAIEGAIKDNVRVQVNSVRALGNLIMLTEAIDDDLKLFEESVQALLQAATSGHIMKVRWNACYALGNILKMNKLYKQGGDLSQKIFRSLGELISNFRNFKVCINASQALSSCGKREFYGDNYLYLWEMLLSALENSENITDYNEYRHRDNLVDRICLTLGHMASMLQSGDLSQFENTINSYDKALETQIRKVYDRLLPEKSTVLFSAKTHLDEIAINNALTEEQANCLNILRKAFNNDTCF